MLNIELERRLYTRSISEVPVKVFYDNTLLARCRTINLCVGGMLICTKEIGLLENSLIQIVFDVHGNHCLYGVRIPAIVLRYEIDNTAISFENLEKGTEELLNSIYLSNNPPHY